MNEKIEIIKAKNEQESKITAYLVKICSHQRKRNIVQEMKIVLFQCRMAQDFSGGIGNNYAQIEIKEKSLNSIT